jgi:thiosulfate reductase cytochrome b subunit
MGNSPQPKHPLAIRWFHWINFPVLFLMIWSGLLIYWANDNFYQFPAWLYEKANIQFRLADGLRSHLFFAWFFTINGALYVAYTVISGEWREFLPGPLATTGKFNPMQRLAYAGVVAMGFGSLVTGLMLWKPMQIGLFGDYQQVRFVHFALTVAYLGFFLVHVTQVIRAGWKTFSDMVTGGVEGEQTHA